MPASGTATSSFTSMMPSLRTERTTCLHLHICGTLDAVCVEHMCVCRGGRGPGGGVRSHQQGTRGNGPVLAPFYCRACGADSLLVAGGWSALHSRCLPSVLAGPHVCWAACGSCCVQGPVTIMMTMIIAAHRTSCCFLGPLFEGAGFCLWCFGVWSPFHFAHLVQSI